MAALLAFVPAAFAGPGTADLGTWYVDDSAAPGGDGSPTSPFRAISEAVAVAQPGDVIDVAAGTYDGFTTVRDGLPGAPIVIRGETDSLDQPLAEIVGQGDERLVNFHHDNITFRDFEVFAGDINLWVGSPLVNEQTTGVRIRDNVIHHANGECVRMKYFSVGNEVEHNHIHTCGVTGFNLKQNSKNGEGVYIGTAPEQLFKNPTQDPDASNENWVHHNVINTKAECVETKEAASFNVIEANTCSGTRDPDGAGFSSRGDHNAFLGNSSTENRGDGIRLGGDSKGQGVLNDVIGNTLANNRGYGLDVQRKPQGEICGNDVTGNRKGITNGGYDPTAPC
jgi:Periplasmic copper-binding protein (NosD)